MDYYVRGHENSSNKSKSFKIPIKVYMCVLNNNSLMAANDFILSLLQNCQLQVFTEKVLRYVLNLILEREFSRCSLFPSVTFQDS